MRARLGQLLVGILLAQAAWMLSVPAFRGLDEFDHVYRAASVARGEWVPSGEQAQRGRGELVTVPRGIVDAAGPECSVLRYTGHDNCFPAADAGADRVLVASAASRYQPLYYWVAGTAALPFDGTSAVYAMRAVSALLCALFVGLAAWTVSRWSRSGWPALALAGSLTPVVAYSSIVVAPNALEIVAATSMWAALVGICRRGLAADTQRTLLWAAVPGAMTLATVRTLGIAFLGLTVLVILAVLGRERVVTLVRAQARTVLACSAFVVAAVLGGVGWVLAAAPNRLEEQGDYSGALATSLLNLPVWVLQSVAAAPSRSHPAPGVVYLLCGGALGALIFWGLRYAETRVRRAAVAVAVLTLALPFALTLATFRDAGVVWQGRYGLPFGVGLLVLAGLALDVHAPRLRAVRARRVATAALAVVGIGQTLAVLHVLDMQRRVSPSIEAGLWSPPSAWLVGSLTVLGWLLVAAALLRPPVAFGGAADTAGDAAQEAPVLAQERLVT